VNQLLSMPDVIEILARNGAAPTPGTPQGFARMIQTDIPRTRRLITDARIVE